MSSRIANSATNEPAGWEPRSAGATNGRSETSEDFGEGVRGGGPPSAGHSKLEVPKPRGSASAGVASLPG